MANLNFIQKQQIDEVFNMKSGYFLNFSNREFEEFMKEVVGYNVYEKYPGLSKAKIFRAFCNEEENRFVGKAIILAINYMRERGLCYGNNSDTEKIYALGKILLGKKEPTNTPSNKEQEDNRSDSDDKIDYSLIQKKTIRNRKRINTTIKGLCFRAFSCLLVWLVSHGASCIIQNRNRSN